MSELPDSVLDRVAALVLAVDDPPPNVEPDLDTTLDYLRSQGKESRG